MMAIQKSRRFTGTSSGILCRSEGSSLVEIALVAPLFILLLVAVVDLSEAFYMAVEVASAAEAGALYGIRFPTDLAGMVSASSLDANNLSTITPTASYGCECSDGTSQVASCSPVPVCTYNVVNYVQVDTVATYTPLLLYPGLPTPFVLSSTVRMRVGHH